MTIDNVTIQNTLCIARSTFRAFTIHQQKTHKKRLFEYMYINKFIFQTKDYQLVCVAYSAKHAELMRKRERAKTDCLGIRIMCQSGATCISADCCFR